MQAPDYPHNDPERLEALRGLNLLDTAPEERFDRLTRLAKRMFKVDIALVSLVDESRQWFKSRQGLEACETGRDISFCGHAILGAESFIVPDAQSDPRFSDNPLVCGGPHIRFYAGVPLTTTDGHRVGTLCIIDSQPRKLDPEERQSLEDIAGCVVEEINRVHSQSLRQQVQADAERVQTMLEAIPDLVFVMDRAGTFVNCQERPDLLVPKAELLGQKIVDIMPASLAQTTLEAIAEALDKGRIVKFETPFKLPQGPAWFEARVCKLNPNEALVLIRNVTREKADQRRLAGVLEGTRIGTWEWNVQTGATVFNERWAEIVGYSLAELEPINIDTWTSLAHPGDLTRSERLLHEHFRGESEFYDCECRMRHKQGHWVWVHDRGRVISWSESGEPLMMYGTHADISTQKDAEYNIQRQIKALTTLNAIASNAQLSVTEQLTRGLQLGLDYLHLELGIISEIIGEQYTVRWFAAPADAGLSSGQQFSLGQTYCSMVLARGDLMAIEHMGESRHGRHPCYQAFGLEAYIGTAIEVFGQDYGTLNFSSPQPRQEKFDEGELMFVRLLARWVASVLERAQTQERLHKLVSQVPGMVYQFQ
ncbi:MAG TPA: GAF domain-containing protein, partial [Cellvibrionaceae bacterium]